MGNLKNRVPASGPVDWILTERIEARSEIVTRRCIVCQQYHTTLVSTQLNK